MASRAPPPPPPPPNVRPPPPPGQQQFQLPIRQPVSSTRYVDLTRVAPLDEDTCKKKLTSYQATSIRKISPRDPKKDITSWEKTEHTKEALSQEEIAKQIKKLNEGPSVAEKKQKLRFYMQSQVNQVLDQLKEVDQDPNFEWSLAQIDQKFQPVIQKKEKKKETTVLTVYAKRTPRREVNVIALYQTIEAWKAEKAAQMTRPLQPLPQEPMRANGIGILKPPKNRKDKRYHEDSSSYSSYTSETDSDLGYSSSENTTISSRSGRHLRKYAHKGRRSRSRSRRREHRRDSYTDDQIVPRSPLFRLHAPYVPDVPRAVAIADEVAAAYQAGKVDADAERFERYPRGRPIISSGVLERYQADTRYAEERYADELRLREEERLRRREADLDRRRYGNPFAQRRYPPSMDDSW